MPAPAAAPRQSLVIGALIVVQILFGANYVISKIVVHAFPPLVWASLRIGIATIVMWGFALAMRRPFPKMNAEFLRPLIGLSLLGTILNQASFLVGLRYTTSANSAVLNTLIPVATLILVSARGQERLTRTRLAGFALAFIGVLIIMRIENFHLSDATVFGDMLNILNCLLYACFLTFGKKFMERHDPIWTTAFLFLYGSVGLFILALPQWLTFVPPVMEGELLRSAAYAVVGGTLATYFLNFWALRHARSSQVALFIYVQPIVASYIAWQWYAQPITARTLAATTMIFLGLLFALSSAPRPMESQEKGA